MIPKNIFRRGPLVGIAKPGTRGFNLSCCSILCHSEFGKLLRNIDVPSRIHLDLARNTDFFVNGLLIYWLSVCCEVKNKSCLPDVQAHNHWRL